MLGFVNHRAEQHQKSRHQGKHRKKAQGNGLDQNQCHIHTHFELHKAQRHQAADGGQRRGADFRNCFGQRCNGSISGIQFLVLIPETVTQNDGIVNGQRQLQHHRHRVGNEADGSENKIGTHIQQGCGTKSDQQHRYFHISPAGEGQNRKNQYHGHHEDHHHLVVQHGVFIVAHQGINVVVVRLQDLTNGIQGLQTDLIKITAVKIHIIQGRSVSVVILCVIKSHHGNAFNFRKLLIESFCRLIGNVGHHDTGCAGNRKVGIHSVNALPDFRILRQIFGNIIFHRYPAHAKNAEDKRKYIQQKKYIPFVYNQCRKLLQKASFFHLSHLFSPLANTCHFNCEYYTKNCQETQVQSR